jgi:DNA-binding NarL/FixJ family response regulator
MTDANANTTIVLGRFVDLLARGLRGLIEDDPSLLLLEHDIAASRLPAAMRSRNPDVAIIDTASLHTPAEVRTLVARHPSTHILLLADEPSAVECAQLLAFGAAACLAKTTQARDVRNAIHLAARGLQLIPRDSTAASAGAGLLTPREADVLAQLQQRRSNAQIAADLHISVETVRTHARHIYRKLGVRSRRELLGPGVGLAGAQAG